MASIFDELSSTDSEAPIAEAIPVVPQIKKDPNPAQLQAIEASVEKAVRVLAPPGSGKTFVLEHRYTHLLNSGIQPEAIVAVTFTAKMAEELLTRISYTNPLIKGTSATDQITTIHALCFRILKAEGIRLQVPFNWQMKKMITEIAEKEYMNTGITMPAWKELLQWVSKPKSRNLTFDNDTAYYESFLDEHAPHVDNIRYKFDTQMNRAGWLTFNDMMFLVEQLFQNNPETLAKYQRKFTHIIVDEGQDTSAQAMRILTALAQPQNNFFIVGDADQLLFRFTGATPEDNLFEGFEGRYPEGQTILLTINYRSSKAIVDACRILISNNYADGGGPYENKYRKEVEPSPFAIDGEPVTYQLHADPDAESRYIANTVEEELGTGLEPGDIFVGARTGAQLGYLEGHLVRKEIPYVNIAGGGFWASKHIADIVAYLQLAVDEKNKYAFKRIYNVASNMMVVPWGQKKGQYCTHRWLGKAFMEKCFDSYEYVWKAVSEKGSFRAGVEDLTEFVSEIQYMTENNTPAEILQFIIDDCYMKYLKYEDGIAGQADNVTGKLQDLLTAVDIAGEYNSIEDFLQYVADAQKASKAVKDKDISKYVVLSTIHRLKGLERPVVFGMGFSEGFARAGATDRPAGLLPHTFSLVPPPQFGTLPAGAMGRVEDERCAAYVLVSRAKDRVYLSGVQSYRSATFSPSRFVKELGL